MARGVQGMMDLTIPFGRFPSSYEEGLAVASDESVVAERRARGEMNRILVE
jgi:hypothetical protein